MQAFDIPSRPAARTAFRVAARFARRVAAQVARVVARVAAFLELAGEPIQQPRIGGSGAMQAEIVRSGHEGFTEKVAIETVDRHARGQWMALACRPVGKF